MSLIVYKVSPSPHLMSDQAGDTYWHESHFTCSECGLRLRDSKVFQKDGLLYCEMDYKKMFVPRCAACSGFILNVGISSLATVHSQSQ